MSHYFIEYTIEKIGSTCRNSIGTLIEIAFQWEGVGCGWCPHIADASDQHKLQHTWILVTMQACFHHRKKVKIIFVTFLSHNSDFYIGIESLHLVYISQFRFIRIVRYCKFTIARKTKSEIVTITLYPLYSMAEIIFHMFHLFKGKKQANIRNAQSNTHSQSSLLPLLKVIFFSLSLILCCSAFTKPIQRGIFSLYVVDVMERASTPDNSSN